jgi:hypothetical protein
MRGVRVIYLGWFVTGVLASLGSAGCCCCPCCCPCTQKPKPETVDPEKSFSPGSRGDQPSHLSPEAIHGGII